MNNRDIDKTSQRIIDAHVHLWDLSLNKHAWLQEPVEQGFLGNYAPLQKDYLAEDYLVDSQNFNVEKIVHVQAGWERSDILGETQWLNSLDKNIIGAIVPYANLTHQHIEQQLAALAAQPKVTAIRQIVAWHSDNYYRACEEDFLINSTWLNNFELLQKYQLAFDLQIYPHQAKAAYSLLKEHPETNTVIEHALQPLAHNEITLKIWEKNIKLLADLPNTYLKLSGTLLFTHHFDLDALKTIVEIATQYFSPQRCMIGSNFPVERLYISYDDLMNAFFEATSQYSTSEQDSLFYDTAQKVYRIN